MFIDAYLAGELTVDFNENGIVNTLDIPEFIRLLFNGPGSSALAP